MHFKRRKPKNRRSGCLMRKYYKMNGLKNSLKSLRPRERKHYDSDHQQVEEFEREVDRDGLSNYLFNEKWDRMEDHNLREAA